VQAPGEGSYDAALRALRADPLIGCHPVAKALLDDFVSAHEGFLRGSRPELRNPVD
jgi:alpha-galactosidase/6-phospho-beta-glucosidase family protein